MKFREEGSVDCATSESGKHLVRREPYPVRSDLGISDDSLVTIFSRRIRIVVGRFWFIDIVAIVSLWIYLEAWRNLSRVTIKEFIASRDLWAFVSLSRSPFSFVSDSVCWVLTATRYFFSWPLMLYFMVETSSSVARELCAVSLSDCSILSAASLKESVYWSSRSTPGSGGACWVSSFPSFPSVFSRVPSFEFSRSTDIHVFILKGSAAAM
mmetsp:Transcript_30315/g.48656  ORF Transcript_30315/g.48656 Transcript_30315/m.48656 type:complete len:211 (+) Transcript_30315:767-1399(+)